MSKTAIYVPNRYAGEDLNLPRALRKRTKGSELFWFSVMGKQRVFSADPGNHANIYTPLTESFSRAVIVGDFPALYDTPFTHAWLFSLLHGMGSEGEIWVQIKAEKTNLLNGLVTEQTLRHHFAELEVKRMTRWGSHWVRISCRESELPSVCFPSIYSFLHGQFNQFQNVYRQAKFRDTQVPETIEEEAWGTYLYSLFGANQKTYLLRKILTDYFADQPVTGLDLGGGYGFMAAELAMQGHRMSMTDLRPFQIEVCQWIQAQCHLQSRLTAAAQTIESASAEDDSLDLVCLFGSLLYVDRKDLGDVFKKVNRMLRPGGIVVIHENMQDIISPTNPDYEKCFRFEELESSLTTHLGKPDWYWASVAKKATSLEQLAKRTVIAVVQKDKASQQAA